MDAEDGPRLIDPNGPRVPFREDPRPEPRQPDSSDGPSFDPPGDPLPRRVLPQLPPEPKPTPSRGPVDAIPRFPRTPIAPLRVDPRLNVRKPRYSPPLAPPDGDFTAASLRQCQDELRRQYGGNDRSIPPAVKAEFLQWVLTRYHLAPYHQVHHTVVLPNEPGVPPEYSFGDDVSTWNGALLAAMSYKYAVTHDPDTLALITDLVDGLHFFQVVTGQRGLPARCIVQSDAPVLRANRRYIAPNGVVYHFRSDAAKGTFNQIAAGYAVMLMLVGNELPPDVRDMAQHDLAEMTTHLLDHKYHITEADGHKTTYGDLTPLIGPVSVPFNAQVAYMMVAASNQFPGRDVVAWKMIHHEYDRLRNKHHVYYEDPRQLPITPQKVAGGPFVKGMNDRNHVMTAAYVGAMLELDLARRQQRQPERRFLFEIGQTMAWTVQELLNDRNALCNFEWAGLLRDPVVLAAVVPQDRRDNALKQLDYLVGTGIEQIRRAPIDRFYYPGKKVETREPQWLDAQRPDEVYCWKAGANYRWEITGPPSTAVTAGTDYLHAYWLMRYFHIAEE